MTTDLDPWERELLESAPPADDRHGQHQCADCWKFRPLRQWPIGERRPMLCDPCWLARVRGDVSSQLLCGEHVVWSVHPQRGVTLRGAIRSVGIEPGGLQPTMRWQLTGPRQDRDLGVFVGDYVDAQARLLDATAELDELDLTTDPDEGE